MIILRQKNFSVKLDPKTGRLEGKIDWKDKAKSAAVFGSIGGLLGGMAGGKKGALIGAGLGAGSGALLSSQYFVDRHNRKIDKKEQERREKFKREKEENQRKRRSLTLSEIEKYRKDPAYSELPKEYWEILKIWLKTKDIVSIWDGDEWCHLNPRMPWEDVFGNDGMYLYLFNLGVQDYDYFSYNSLDEQWVEGWDEYEPMKEKPIKNLKSYLIKAFENDLEYWKKDEFGVGEEICKLVIKQQMETIRLIRQYL